MKKSLLTGLFCILSLFAINAQNADIQAIINEVKSEFAPDKRICVYDINLVQSENVQVLKGEISDNNIHNILISKIKQVSPEIKDSVRVLPDSSLGNEYWGFVHLSLIIVRVAPNYRAEICTQALMGTPVKILEKKNGWLHIQTPDGYIGWTSTDDIRRMNELDRKAYNSLPKLVVTAYNDFVYEKPDDKSMLVSDVIMGNILVQGNKTKSASKKFYAVTLPDGRKGYISTKSVIPYAAWQKSIVLTGESIVSRAEKFIGLPYVWGGTSSRGLDCSGLSKTTYFMHGIILPRDASQQYRIGKEIDTTNGFENLKAGDLLFFGRKNESDPSKPSIIHVAIYIGNQKYIHASGQVRINSFDPDSEDFDAYNRNRYIGAKRILGTQMKSCQRIFEHPWYN